MSVSVRIGASPPVEPGGVAVVPVVVVNGGVRDSAIRAEVPDSSASGRARTTSDRHL